MTVRKAVLALIAAAALFGGTTPVQAELQPSYNYSYWGDPVPAPPAYVPERTVYGAELGIGRLNAPQDLFTSPNREVYIADTGNNRIIVLNDQADVVRVVGSFDHDGKKDGFNHPEGVFATDNGDIYVADTDNHRVVQLDAHGKLVKELDQPVSSLIRQSFQFEPTKVAVNRAGQVFVVSHGAYEGIMEFESDGRFFGFFGSNRVRFNPLDLLWKRISTRTQRDQMEQFVPVEFNNLAMADNGFVYTTTSLERDSKPIKLLNVSGVDILRSKGYFPPEGDIRFTQQGNHPGSSIFVDVASDEAGMYSGLDSKRGHIFTYDKDGNLLYEFAGLGSGKGLFRTPSAIAMLGQDVLVLDMDNNSLTQFTPTQYGLDIREAVRDLEAGQPEKSAAAWRKVLQLNSNLDIAYIGIGKSLLRTGDARQAMSYFKLGNNREYYSKAFKLYRQDFVYREFGKLVLGIALFILLLVLVVKWAKRRTAGAFYEEIGILRNPFYTLFHPFNGFWEMKFEQKGRVKLALFLVFLVAILTIVKKQYSGFVVNDTPSFKLNSLDELKFVVLPFVLWCVANWSLTTLMDGEGKFREIVMATGYALMPMVIIYLPQTLFSNIITLEEAAFYHLLDAIVYIWFVWLLFVGTMTVHGYSPSKTVATMLLTLVVIGIMLFLGLLFFSMLQQMVSFVTSLYREQSLRW